MASKRIDIAINSTNAGTGFKSAGSDISKLKSEAGSAGTTIGQSISQGASTGTAGLNKLATTGSKTFGTLKAGASAARQSIGDLGSAISSLAGGIGAMEVAQSMWTGSTQKQFNSAYLQTKMSKQAANEYIKTIQKVVSEVPGDDTFMNNLMTGAVAKNTNLTNEQLKKMGNLAADYLVTSQSMGKAQLETQMDLKEYLLTGNTTQLERDSILKNQMTTLEGTKSVQERILALDKAMKAEGYEGLSQLDIASIKWEEIKGKLQLAATTIGDKILPTVEKVFKWFLDLDEKTQGWASLLVVAIGTLGLVALALSPIVTATASAATAMAAYRKDAEKAALANAANKGPAAPVAGTAAGGTVAGAGGGILGALGTAAPPVAGGLLGTLVAAAGGGLLKLLNDQLQGTHDKLKQILSLAPGGTMGGGVIGAALLGEKFSPAELIASVSGPLGQIYFQVTAFWSQVKWAFEQVKPYFQMFSDWFNTVLVKPFKDSLAGANEWGNYVNQIAANTSATVTSYINNIGPSIQNGWNQIVNGARWVGDSIRGAFLGAIDSVTSNFWSLVDNARSAWNSIKDAVMGPINAIIGGINSLKSAIGFGAGPDEGVPSGSNRARGGGGAGMSFGDVGQITNAIMQFANSQSSKGMGVPMDIIQMIGKGGGFGSFLAAAQKIIGGLSYQFYYGPRQNALVTGGGNCVDLASALIRIAGLFGIPGHQVQGYWGSIPHNWANIGGINMDPTAFLKRGTWAPSGGAGPPPSSSRSAGPGEGMTIHIHGNVLDGEDFKRMVEKANGSISYDAGMF